MIVERLWRLGQSLVTSLPISVTYPVAVAVADLGWLVMPVQRRNAVANMEQILGGRQPRRARRLARRSFQNYARYVVDFMRQPMLSEQYLREHLDAEHCWPDIEAALASGKGCILVLTHFGNWDFGAAVLMIRGYPFNAIAEAQGNEELSRAIFTARAARGLKLIPMERAATGILRAMRRSELLAILIDRPISEGGVEVEFFGAPTRVPEGPARIALRTGARVLPVSLLRVRESDDHVRAIMDFDITLPATGDRDADVRALTQAIMTAHERVIRRHPEQWYMFRRMWPA